MVPPADGDAAGGGLIGDSALPKRADSWPPGGEGGLWDEHGFWKKPRAGQCWWALLRPGPHLSPSQGLFPLKALPT